jgi:hypothetical protein
MALLAFSQECIKYRVNYNIQYNFASTTCIEGSIVYYLSVNLVSIKHFKWTTSANFFSFVPVQHSVLNKGNVLLHDYSVHILECSGFLSAYITVVQATSWRRKSFYSCIRGLNMYDRTGLKISFPVSSYPLSCILTTPCYFRPPKLIFPCI